jgi:ABC-type uncharacterized transport system auxiliary subunit
MKSRVRDDFPKNGVGDDFAAGYLASRKEKSSLTPKSSLTLFFCSVAVALLAACSAITRQPTVRQTFLIEPPPLSAVAQSHPGALRVGTVAVAAPFRGKSFVFRIDELRYETDFYDEFIVTPASMLTDQTTRALAQARPFTRMAGPGATADADFVLDGFATALYADIRQAGKPAAEIAITYYLTPTSGGERTPIWSHEYRRHAPMRDASPVAYAEALNTAFAEIVGELARDLAAVKLPAS